MPVLPVLGYEVKHTVPSSASSKALVVGRGSTPSFRDERTEGKELAVSVLCPGLYITALTPSDQNLLGSTPVLLSSSALLGSSAGHAWG